MNQKWSNINAAGAAGQRLADLGATIGDAIYRGGHQGRSQDQDFQMQQLEEQFKKRLLLEAATNPNLASAIQQPQESTVDGQQALKAMPVRPGSENDNLLKTPAGFVDTTAFKKAQVDDDARKFQQQYDIHKLIADAAANRTTYSQPIMTDQGLVQFPTRGPNVGQAIVPTVGGSGGAQAPLTAPQKMKQFTDAKGDLWQQSATGGAASQVKDAEGNAINVGIPNKILSTDEGFVSVPSKGDGPITPLVGSTGKPLTKVSVTSDQGSRLSAAQDKMLENAATASVQLGRAGDLYTGLYDKGLAGPVAGRVQGKLAQWGYGNKDYVAAQAQIGPAVYQMARALHGVGVIRKQDLDAAEQFGERLTSSPDQFKGSLAGVAQQYLNSIEGFAKMKKGIMSPQQSQNIRSIAENLAAVSGKPQPWIADVFGGASSSEAPAQDGQSLLERLKAKHDLQ